MAYELKELDLRGDIIDFGEDFFMVDYPAFSYLHAARSNDKPICVDKGGRHLGEAVPGVAVAFPTRNHGFVHKHFGIGFYEGGDGGEAGEPYAYGKGASLTSEARPKEWLAAAFIGDVIVLQGKRYQIAGEANNNIKLVACS